MFSTFRGKFYTFDKLLGRAFADISIALNAKKSFLFSWYYPGPVICIDLVYRC